MLMEYIDGKVLSEFENKKILSYKKDIIKAIQDLHKNRLSSNDIAPWNIMISNEKLKIIDLSDDTIYCISKVKDIMEACRYYEIDINKINFKKGIIYYYPTLRNKIRAILKTIKGKCLKHLPK